MSSPPLHGDKVGDPQWHYSKPFKDTLANGMGHLTNFTNEVLVPQLITNPSKKLKKERKVGYPFQVSEKFEN